MNQIWGKYYLLAYSEWLDVGAKNQSGIIKMLVFYINTVLGIAPYLGTNSQIALL